jgi:transcriptional regulator with XRE-family HTH domain
MASIRLEEVLAKKKLSKRKFAKQMGVSYHAVFHYFRKGYNPTFEMMAKWAKAAGCRIRDLIEE